MKCWIYILITCFLGLSFQPCADTDFFTQEYTYSHNEDGDSSHEHEMCNPLCFCNCCGGNVLLSLQNLSTEFVEPELAQELFIHSSEGFLSNYLCEIWQPPKL